MAGPPAADPSQSPAVRVRTAATALTRVAARWLVAAAAPVHRAWRRSLQVRVITITLIASGVLVGAFGYLVVELSTRNLLTRAQQAALEQLQTDGEYARGQLGNFSAPNDRELVGTMHQIVSSRAEGDRLLVLIAPPGVADPVATRNAPVASALSAELLGVVGDGNRAWQILTAQLDEDDDPTTYLAYGQPVPARWSGPSFQLYSLTSLTTEVDSANDIRRTVLAAGGALVVLLATVTALVTRMVVRPVRLAARTARRLSAGLLDQRMTVVGEDDLALLGASFNQMAENLQRQILRLEEMSRLQRRFTSDVSHELRTPLTTIRMAADLIFSERESYPPEVARSAELLQHELDRFESLLTDLLEISRFDAGFAALDGEPTDLGLLLRQAVDALAPLCVRAGSQIRLQLPDQPVIAEVDRRRFDRILRNLLGNAAEHGEGRPIDVTLAGGDAAVAVTVRDYGVGLRPGHDKLVFNRFWRADPSRARQTGGTGLGLSISLEDARLHGGWLEVWGEAGRGTAFRLTLPVRVGDRLRESPLPLVPVNADESLTGVGP